MTPHIGYIELYKTSGHYEKYGADSFQSIKTPNEGEEFFLKPMNCPHHCEIYKTSQWSYKDLPKRYAEFGTVYRYEQSGELHGLTRVRGFTQDDAHLFCTPDQLLEEFKKTIDLDKYQYKTPYGEVLTGWRKKLKYKKFKFCSIQHEHYTIGLAIADIAWAGHGFVYIYNQTVTSPTINRSIFGNSLHSKYQKLTARC